MTTTQKLEILPEDFGGYWMSKNAQDLCRIAVAFGGYSATDLVARLVMKDLYRKRRHSEPRAINCTTVEAVLAQMRNEFDTH